MPASIGKLKFDQTGERFFETGVSHGVLFVYDESTTTPGDWKPGVAWNGLTSVTEAPEGAEANAIYADNIKYLNLISAEDYKGTIEAYTYPKEWGACDGSAPLDSNFPGIIVGQQKRAKFCLVYITKVGNDESQDLGEKIHIVYNCIAAPSERNYETVNDSPEAINSLGNSQQHLWLSMLLKDLSQLQLLQLTQLSSRIILQMLSILQLRISYMVLMMHQRICPTAYFRKLMLLSER